MGEKKISSLISSRFLNALKSEDFIELIECITPLLVLLDFRGHNRIDEPLCLCNDASLMGD